MEVVLVGMGGGIMPEESLELSTDGLDLFVDETLCFLDAVLQRWTENTD